MQAREAREVEFRLAIRLKREILQSAGEEADRPRPVKWCTSLTAGSPSLFDGQAAIIGTSRAASAVLLAIVLAIASRLM